eukprot:552217-Amphidinium_carterae.1
MSSWRNVENCMFMKKISYPSSSSPLSESASQLSLLTSSEVVLAGGASDSAIKQKLAKKATQAADLGQHSSKRKMTEEARGKQKKQGDCITNFYNVRIGNYHAATSSTSTEQLKRTSRTAEDYYIDTKGAYNTHHLTTLSTESL